MVGVSVGTQEMPVEGPSLKPVEPKLSKREKREAAAARKAATLSAATEAHVEENGKPVETSAV